MYIRPGAASEIGDQVTDVEGSLTGFFKIDDQGELHIYDGPESNEWLPTGAQFDLDENGNATNWIRLSFRQDFENGLWDIAIDGHIFRANLAMADRAESLEKIEFVGQSRSPLYIDDIQVSRDAIAFSDADCDGLPDDWEAGQDLARDGDPDSDGLTNVEEFVLGSNVNAADTDGDGVNDGDEYEAGTDPLVGTEAAESAAVLSWTGPNNGLQVSISPYGSNYHFIDVSWSSYTEWKIWVYNDWNYPYVYEYMTNQSIGTGSSNWTSSTDYVISTTGQVAFIYIWAADHTNGSVENSVLLKTTSGSDGQVISSNSSIGGGNLGSDEAAEEALDDHCLFCYVSGPSDPDCVDISLGSVRFNIGLGTSDFGRRRHNVGAHERSLTQHSYSRESLSIDNQGIEVGYDFPTTVGSRRISSQKAKKVISWAKTDTRFVTFNDIEGGYEIRKYTLNQVSEDHIPSGEPYTIVTVRNPDHPVIHANNRRLILEKTEDGRKSIHEYRYFANKAQGRETWELYQGAPGSHLAQPLRLKRLVIDDPDAAERGDYTKTHTVHHWNSDTGRIELDSKQRETFRRFDFGERKVMRVVDPDNEALTVKIDYYGREAGDFPVVGRVKSIQWADGGWEYYTYDTQGRETNIYRPANNAPLPVSEPGHAEGYESEKIEYDGPEYQEKRTHYLNGRVVDVSYKQWDRDDFGKDRKLVEIKVVNENAAANDLSNRRTESIYQAGDRRMLRQTAADGSETRYQYTEQDRTLVTSKERFHSNGNLNDRHTTIRHRSGTILENKRIDGASGILTQHQSVDPSGLDERFRAVATLDHISGEITTRSYNCCGLEWQTDGKGATTRHEYDLLGRVIRTQSGYKPPMSPDNTLTSVRSDETYHLNGNDLRLKTTNLIDPGESPQLAPTTSHYDLAGRLVSNTNASGLRTESKTVMLPDGGRIELTSYPKSGHDNRHRIQHRRYDANGKLKRQMTYASSDPFSMQPDPRTLNGRIDYSQGADEIGYFEESASVANLFDIRRTRTYKDLLGQTTKVIHAYGSRHAVSEIYDYNEDGQLIRHIDPDGVTTRYAYNEEGERSTTAIDLDINPDEAPNHIDYEVDRISVVDHSVIQRDGEAFRRTENKVYTETGPITTSIQETSLTRDQTWSWQYHQLSTSVREEGDAPGSWMITNTDPSGAYTVQSYENGHFKQTSRYAKNGVLISWKAQDHDAYGRLLTITDSRTGTTAYHYDDQGRRWKVSAPNPETRSSTNRTLDTIYRYDALGQVITTVKPSGGQIHQVYNANGTLHKTHGYHTTDVQWGYNGRGERTHMTTWYSHLNKPATTRWFYNVRGQLQFKQDAHGRRVHYTYTPGRKLETRTWARGVQTTYHYDDANNLTHIDYSDNTPDVHFTYTRLGQKQTVRDAGGLLTYAYRPDQPTVLLSETRSGDFQSPPNPNNRTISPLYNESKTLIYNQDELNRPTGFQIGTPANPTQDYAVTYGYDQANRLDRVSSQGYDFVYKFESMSTTDRLQSVTADGIKHTQYQYEPGRDTTTDVINQAGPNNQLISHYAYRYNQDGQRTERTTTTLNPESGILSPSYTDAFHYHEDTGGLTKSIRDANPQDPNSESYHYDKIGNRTSIGKGNGDFALYDTNSLNQYTSIWDHDGIQAVRHDVDGNQLSKGNQEYTWDAENRLVEVRERGALRACYTYDHRSRRIARWTNDNIDERYLYDGWSLVNTFRPNGKRLKSFTWGRDISGTLGGAGGSGGLSFFSDDRRATNWFYHYDANGNVAQISSPKSKECFTYSYSAFGIPKNLDKSNANRFLYSTKIYDEELGSYFYGFRYYSPTNGRWSAKDPIGEKGGFNLYAFVSNQPTNRIDILGLVDAVERRDQKLHVDADGAANAYGPNNTGLDYTDNAGGPGNWYGVVTDKAGTSDWNKGNPLIQGADDPYPGLYFGQTPLQDTTKNHDDTARYVDARFVPYVVKNTADTSSGVRYGDFATIVNVKTGQKVHAIVADHNGSSSGEASIYAAILFGVNSNPRNGGDSNRDYCFLLYKNSRKSPAWPVHNVTILQEGNRLYDEWKEDNQSSPCCKP